MRRMHGDEERADSDEIEFEWDPQKAISNYGKHKVSFEEARTVFGD